MRNAEERGPAPAQVDLIPQASDRNQAEATLRAIVEGVEADIGDRWPRLQQQQLIARKTREANSTKSSPLLKNYNRNNGAFRCRDSSRRVHCLQ